MAAINRKLNRSRVRSSIRRKIRGNAERPRLAVFRSAAHIYCQAIDDDGGRTLAQASTVEKGIRSKLERGSNIAAAKEVGVLIAERLKALDVKQVVFDRGGFVYHGRIQALADAAREGGLQF